MASYSYTLNSYIYDSYTYTVSRYGYDRQTGAIDVYADGSMAVSLVPSERYAVAFEATDGRGACDGPRGCCHQ